MSEWTIGVTPMPTEEALDNAARIADAEEPDCEDLLLTEGARVCDVLRCEVLHQADVIERRTAELSTATGEVERLRAALAEATSAEREKCAQECEARAGAYGALSQMQHTLGRVDEFGIDVAAESADARCHWLDAAALLRAALAVTQREREETEDASEVDHLDALLARQHAILTGVADALLGDPGPLASHSHHDLAERAAAMVALLAVTQASLEAASSGRRVTACDDIERLQRENATLRAAYAQDLDGLRAELRRADDERATWRDLRDAARECLDALEAPAPVWDADESEHDAHAARLEVARVALRALVAPR